MEIKAIINRLLVGTLIILLLSYHLVYNAYLFSILNGKKGYLIWFGMKIHGSIFIDLILYISLGLLLILLVIIK